MFHAAFDSASSWMDRGGWVMWPLLGCSLLAFTLIFERCWFWTRTAAAWRRFGYPGFGRALREGQRGSVRAAIDRDPSVYGAMLRRVIDEGASDAAAVQAIEEQRYRMERFMATLNTIITAAPLLGILGAVNGIITSFTIIGNEFIADPSQVAGGISEALLPTAFGLAITIPVLFPYNIFRVRVDRALSRMETLATAAQTDRS